jgi:hypothetical protein
MWGKSQKEPYIPVSVFLHSTYCGKEPIIILVPSKEEMPGREENRFSEDWARAERTGCGR